MPEALKQCGYDTEMFGKWHVGMFHKDYHPQNRGFDHFLGFLTGGADFWSHKKCYGKQEDFGFMCGYDFREAYAGTGIYASLRTVSLNFASKLRTGR